MLIKITEVGEIETKREGKRRWKEIRLDYETAEKKDNYKILLDWANPDAFEEAKDCLPDQFYEVKVKKDGKYWNWVGIQESDADEFDDAPKSRTYDKAKPSSGTDWAAKNKLDADRFEFEKAKQDLIIRQSCIGYAIQAIGPGADMSRYLQLAQVFETNVWQGFEVAQHEVAEQRKGDSPKPRGDREEPVSARGSARRSATQKEAATGTGPSDMDDDIPF